MKKVIMIDLDGVVLNKDYKTTKDIHSTIKKLGNNDLIVPNSDTPINRLKRLFSGSLGINPMITIGEKGAVIDFFGTVFYPCHVLNLRQYRKKIIKTLGEYNARILESEFPIQIRKFWRFPPGENLIIVDNSRRASLSIFFLKANSEGILKADKEWSDLCFKALSQIKIPEGLGQYEYNYKYGIAISNAIDSSKGLGVQLLKEKLGRAIYFMIGDSDADIIKDEDVLHLAVNNATDDLKNISDFTASKNYTEGLEECLEWIVRF
jgi:hydroxymethylpyrimidine pyrophosphatase-like HAD family hydrolase